MRVESELQTVVEINEEHRVKVIEVFVMWIFVYHHVAPLQ